VQVQDDLLASSSVGRSWPLDAHQQPIALLHTTADCAPPTLQIVAKFSRQMASSAAGGIGRKAIVLGAAGGIDQPLSMLMQVVASVP
jgi:hypothetical protein